MKRVRLEAFCDGHDDDTEVEATIERVITIDGCKPVLLDLCDQCDKDVIVVAELLSRGVLAENPKRKPKPVIPPIEGEDSKTTTLCRLCPHNAASRSALGAHARNFHGVGLREMFAS